MSHRPHHLVFNKGRRTFLAGAAGALALPFLESVARPGRAGAWSPAPGMPHRLVIFFNGHGLVMEEFIPRPGFAMGEILRPVADAGLDSKMLVVTGVDSKVEGGHPGAPSLLTCTPLVANQYGVTHATSASVDHVIARHMQDGGAARRLDVGVHDESTDPSASGRSNSHVRTFWSGEDELIETLIKPQLAFDQVFPEGAGDPGTMTETTVDLRAVRRRSVLDGVLRQFNSLRSRVSSSDQARLDLHADKVRDIENSLQTTVTETVELPPSCTGGPALGPFTGLNHAQVAEMQIDILAHAIACNQIDVGTFKHFDMEESAWGHVSHPDLGAAFRGGNYHEAWHSAADDVPPARRAFTAINAWFGSMFARLLSRLNDFDEGDGTALDHTMVMWISDFGDSGAHASGNLPIAIAGNAGGARLGRHVNFAIGDPTSPWGNDAHPGNHNLAVTLSQAFGISGDRFGNYTNVASPVGPGPLSL
ncbi:MAG: DUF1552 domain-containing protein [Myxococcota bacterium]